MATCLAPIKECHQIVFDKPENCFTAINNIQYFITYALSFFHSAYVCCFCCASTHAHNGTKLTQQRIIWICSKWTHRDENEFDSFTCFKVFHQRHFFSASNKKNREDNFQCREKIVAVMSFPFPFSEFIRNIKIELIDHVLLRLNSRIIHFRWWFFRSFIRYFSSFVSLSFAIYMKIVAHNVKAFAASVANEYNMKKCSNKLLQRIRKRAKEKLHCIHINHVCAPKNHRKKKTFPSNFFVPFACSFSRFAFTFVFRKSNLFFSVVRCSDAWCRVHMEHTLPNITYLHNINLNKLLRFFLFSIFAVRSECMLNGYAEWILYCVMYSERCAGSCWFFSSLKSFIYFIHSRCKGRRKPERKWKV